MLIRGSLSNISSSNISDFAKITIVFQMMNWTHQSKQLMLNKLYIRVEGLFAGNLQWNDERTVEVTALAHRSLLLKSIGYRIVVTRLESDIIGRKQVFFNESQHSNAQNNSQGIIEDVSREIPDAGVTLKFRGKLHGNSHVNDMRQKLRDSLFRCIHRPNSPRPLWLLDIAFVDQNTEGERPQNQLNHDSCETYQLA